MSLINRSVNFMRKFLFLLLILNINLIDFNNGFYQFNILRSKTLHIDLIILIRTRDLVLGDKINFKLKFTMINSLIYD